MKINPKKKKKKKKKKTKNKAKDSERNMLETRSNRHNANYACCDA